MPDVLTKEVHLMDPIKTVTYNIRCVWKSDGEPGFASRGGLFYDKVLAERPDIIAFQEMIPQSLAYLRRVLPEYTFVGSGRCADYGGEGLYIAFRNDSCDLLGYDMFWMSPTPRVPASRFDGQSSCPRNIVEVIIRHKPSGKIVRYVSVHLDFTEEVQLTEAKCLLDILAEKQERYALPTVIMGDFNSLPDSEVTAYMHGDGRFGLRDVAKDIPVTYHEYGNDATKIDYIYVTGDIEADNVSAWTDKVCGIWLSDHYPICAELTVK